MIDVTRVCVCRRTAEHHRDAGERAEIEHRRQVRTAVSGGLQLCKQQGAELRRLRRTPTTTQSKAARDGGGHRAAFPGPPARMDTLFFAQRLAPSKARALPAAAACRGRARRHAAKDTKRKYNGRAPAETRLQPVPPVVFPSAARLNRPLAPRGAASQRAPHRAAFPYTAGRLAPRAARLTTCSRHGALLP
ncbi:hypothetical protein HPB50_020147 [Hyalomma asiaticum]|uniref:Uncharacterized protein n=1 Tax=Hyalomma asiaticum TaxID=266040 RepID=A0ACB7TKJ3_HYAAI|nr:hypothetical protein HPB50_020147 [Hyalomma asiaticum]